MEPSSSSPTRGELEITGGNPTILSNLHARLYRLYRLSRLYRDDLDDLASLVPSLMYFAVLPYLGPEAANEDMQASTG